MRESTKRRIGGVAIAGMVIAGVAAFSSMSASGAEGPTGPEAGPNYVPYGTLTINLIDRDGYYELKDPAGNDILNPDTPNPDYDPVDNPDVPEFLPYPSPETIITNQPCATVEPGTGDLMVLAPNPASATNEFDVVQVRDNALGVNTGNTSCGSSAAALISGSEQLKFELGPILPENVYIESATLNWTQNKSGDLTYILEGGQTDTTDVGRNAPPQSTTAAAAFDEDGKVVVEELTDLFKSITVESTAKKDNEGISILTGTTFNLVQLGEFEAAVFCGEQVTANGASGDIADTVRFFRGENSFGTPACQDVGVTVEIVNDPDNSDPTVAGGQQKFVYWDNKTEGVVDGTFQGVEGLVTIDWAPVPVAEADRLDRKIDYDGYGDGGAFDTLWCLSYSATTDADGKVTFEVTMPTYDDDNDASTDEVDAPWCLVSDTRELIGDKIHQTEVMFGGGDPMKW